MDKNKKRPVRANSYQGSYLEVPFADNDDLYSGRIFTFYSDLSSGQGIAREINKDTQSARASSPKRRAASYSPRQISCEITAGNLCTPLQADVNVDKMVKLEVTDDVLMDPTTSNIENIDARNGKRKMSGGHVPAAVSVKKMKLECDLDSIMMPPPPLPTRPRKTKPKFSVDHMMKPEVKPTPLFGRDWHVCLEDLYGSVEAAEEKPWMTAEEKDILSRLPEKHQVDHKFRIQHWDLEVEKPPTDDALFRLPADNGLASEISKQLQFVRDSISLYRTMALPNSNENTHKRPVFLPFLRRNLRYNNYIPVPLKNTKIAPKKVEELTKTTKISTKQADGVENGDNTESECSDQDMGIKLISVKHKLLPAGHNASVTFFYTRYSYKQKTFYPVNKIDSSTFVIQVQDNILPVHIDLPPELDYDEEDPSDLFIILRFVFFDASKEGNDGRSMRSVPARLAGQCERAREAEVKSGKPTRRMRETKEGDQAMFGAFQLTKKTTDGWSYACGATSLILVETEKLDINPNSALWQKDGAIVFRMIALGRKYHSNPFAYMEVMTCDDDDSVVSLESKKPKKGKRRSRESVESTSCHPADFKSLTEEDMEFDYSLPPLMVYQLSLDFLRQNEDGSKSNVTAGFNAFVSEKDEVVPANVQRIYDQRSKLNTEPKVVTNLHKEVLETIDQRDPSPQMFSYKVTRAAGWCIFCDLRCHNLFSLMWHLKTCHSRFEYVYKAVIEYKAGHYLPGIVMKKGPLDEDMYWNRRKLGICARYKRAWPHKFSLDGDFITPCSFLFKKVVDTFQDVAPTLSLKEEFNRLGPRPINYSHTVHGRLVKMLPQWMAEKMQHDLEDIVDLDNLEIVFMLLWNNHLFEYGPAAGKETNVYRLCRLFIEMRRKEIQDNHLEIATLILVSYFVEQKILSAEELYDLLMRLNRNYNPFTDILHPLSVSEKLRAQVHLKREAAKAEKLRRRRPKKVYEKSTISLRRREQFSTDTSRCTSNEPTPDQETKDTGAAVDSRSSEETAEKNVSTTSPPTD